MRVVVRFHAANCHDIYSMLVTWVFSLLTLDEALMPLMVSSSLYLEALASFSWRKKFAHELFSFLVMYTGWPESHLTSMRVTHQVCDYIWLTDLRVRPCCLHSMPILPDLHLPKKNKAKSKTSKCSRRPDGPPCTAYSYRDPAAAALGKHSDCPSPVLWEEGEVNDRVQNQRDVRHPDEHNLVLDLEGILQMESPGGVDQPL